VRESVDLGFGERASSFSNDVLGEPWITGKRITDIISYPCNLHVSSKQPEEPIISQ
jgi:hypothetical protein